MNSRISIPWRALPVLLFLVASPMLAADPVVSNVFAKQREGTQLVDITFDLADPANRPLIVSVAVSDNGGWTYTVPASTFTGDVGTNVTPGNHKRITWDAGQDWTNKFSANMRFRVTADTTSAPAGMVPIPEGSFTMGDAIGEGLEIERPVHTVYLNAFYMDQYEVTMIRWSEVRSWAVTHGYTFDKVGSVKTTNHPVHTVTWYDVVKWCNARSEKEGRVPAYYTDAAQTNVYRMVCSMLKTMG